ncbi:MAG: DMT family transporter [Halofilum sp. (in: g-proteobacteria)]|nr:DMT family transporter [Halofilum sp. (in: g-proteobacteria)]
MTAERQAFGLAIALTGVLVLTPDALLIRLVSADRATLLFWRALLEGLTLWAVLALYYRGRLLSVTLAMGWLGLLATGVFALSTILFVSSITLTTAANTLFILSTAPLFAAVISWLVLGERVALRTWVAIALALLGIGIIFGGGIGGGTVLGDALAVATAISLAAQLSIARHARASNLVPALAAGMLLVALLTGFTFAAPLSIGRMDVLWLGLLGCVVLPVAFGLLTLAPRYIPSPEVSLIMQLEAVLGPLWVWLGVGEVPPLATFIGGGLVFFTLVIHSALGLRAYRNQRRGGGRIRPVSPHGPRGH